MGWIVRPLQYNFFQVVHILAEIEQDFIQNFTFGNIISSMLIFIQRR
ncbi:MAG: hypothetical protein UZ12_BCD005001397 [Bacteroidetes bacterium OLB12]|nr:MAG: hypothetical protein UZ12_BCD005001397 [Bacteroidetes bacterium OLB12]